MVSRSPSRHRCDTCRLLPSLCICSELPRLDIKTRLTLVMNHKERFRTTNTGILALACLNNSRLVLKGLPDEVCEPHERALLLYPCAEAISIEDLKLDHRSVRLVVPDGTWPEAKRICSRNWQLRDMTRVALPDGAPSRYRLRANPHLTRLATMEAVARALGCLEGLYVQQILENIFFTMIDRQLWLRGWLAEERVHGGIPSGVVRHDPFPVQT